MDISLTPYARQVARAGARYASYSPRLRAAAYAGRAANIAYTHRAEAAHAARTIKRAFKRYKARNSERKAHPVNKIGATPSVGTNKRHATVDGNVSLASTRLLYLNDILNVPQGSELNSRVRDIVNVKGFKLRMEIKSLLESGDFLLFNIALISPKSATTIGNTDFFRSSDNSRGQDFDVSLNSTEFHLSSINTDKYHVLMHQRYKLGDSMNDKPVDHVIINKYIPINRQFRYISTTPATEETNDRVFLVFWGDKSMTSAGAASITGAFQTQQRGILYFSEPHECCK